MKNPHEEMYKKFKRRCEMADTKKMPNCKSPEFDEIQKNPCNAGRMPL